MLIHAVSMEPTIWRRQVRRSGAGHATAPTLLNVIYPDIWGTWESVDCGIWELSDSERQAGHVSTRKTPGESDLGRPVSGVAESRLRVSPRYSPLSIPVMVPMSCLHFISRSFGGAKD
jgi:hypothetical protein